jgi:F420-dependent oxidoreductase-like protein
MLEAYTLLGALAARTKRVDLGTLVTGVTYRNPAMLAKIVTTLDIISKGRAILGIGAAWYDVEHEGLGFEFPPVKERFERLEEALQICRAMFTEDRPTFEGRHSRISEARNLPRPVRPGGPPIMVGGSGEKRTLRLVAQYADLCNLFGDPTTISHKLEVLHRHCADVGRDPAEITTTRLGSLFLTDSAEQTAEVRGMLGETGGPEFAAMATVGTESAVVEERSRRISPSDWTSSSSTSRWPTRRGSSAPARCSRDTSPDRARPVPCLESADVRLVMEE